MRQAERQLVAPDYVGGVSRDQLAVFLDALLVVAGEPRVHPARVVALALGHPVDVAESFLDVCLRFLQLPEVPRHTGEALITDAETRIELDRLQQTVPRFLEPVVRRRLECRREMAYDIERGRREAGHREHLRRLRFVVAEALRTRVIRRVDASRTWSLLVAVPCALVITSPVTACVARTEIR